MTEEEINALVDEAVMHPVSGVKPRDPRMRRLSEFPKVIPEGENKDILIKGRWLERGCGSFVVSTAGTGKSIHSLQLALAMTAGVANMGLSPWRPVKVWIIQSEDSESRISIDREDITSGLSDDIPGVNWSARASDIEFVKMTGRTGSAFLADLNNLLGFAKDTDQLPDIVIINPLLAFLGGDMSSSNDVGAFLRGGRIAGNQTEGLQAILERFNVATIIYHHTGKPSAKDIESWQKSPYPEYQCAGSSEITNWGRSFITMLRCKSDRRMVMLTAGKNGAGLGWREYGGAPRLFLHYSDALSCDGAGNRHYWRAATDDEISAELRELKLEDKEDAVKILTAQAVAELKKRPMTTNALRSYLENKDRTNGRTAFNAIVDNPKKHSLMSQLASKEYSKGRPATWLGVSLDMIHLAIVDSYKSSIGDGCSTMDLVG